MYNFNYMDCLEKSALQAGFTILAGKYLMPEVTTVLIPFIGRGIPYWVFTGTVGFIASHINDALHNLIKPETHLKHKGEDIESLALGAVVGAGTFMGSLYLMNPRLLSGFGVKSAALVGAGGDILGAVAFNYLRA